MDTYKIVSVEIIDGKTLNNRWHSPMQKITTNKGEFIDNEPGKTFGDFPPGFDWKLKIGKTVQAKVTISANNKWISFKSDTVGKTNKAVTSDDNLVTTSSLAKKLGIPFKTLNQKLVDCSYLEEQDGRYQLTPKGTEVGGKSRISRQHGLYFMWPSTLEL